jgi:transposase InsO family protein
MTDAKRFVGIDVAKAQLDVALGPSGERLAVANDECELLDRRHFRTWVEARMAVFEFIEGWYNPHRRHSALDYLSPINYERNHYSEGSTASPPPST